MQCIIKECTRFAWNFLHQFVGKGKKGLSMEKVYTNDWGKWEVLLDNPFILDLLEKILN